MHADELRMAVAKVVSLLDKAQVRAAVDQYRAAKGDQRTAAAARLGHAGALIMEKFDEFSDSERLVVKCLHLESLGNAEYWKNLLEEREKDPNQRQAEIVRLASRVMFASNHLPAMMSLLRVSDDPETNAAGVGGMASALPPVEAGEGALYMRLTDAGERASDPDRIARAIDGIDMLYSACASIARKPAMDLRLDGVFSKENRDRDFRFTGERDSVSAVFAVVDSIPAALAEIDPEQDIDLDSVVGSLPVFQDLNTLASLGTFSSKDLKDISETMHQGALLTLESGVILIDEELASQPVNQSVPASSGIAGSASQATSAATAETRDEHYDRYLREREAMKQTGSAVAGGEPGSNRQEAVDELLKSLGQTRTS